MPRLLVLLLLLLHPAVGFCEEQEEDSGRARLVWGIRYYRAGDHDKARATLIELLTDETVTDRELRLTARVYLAEVLFVEDRREAALAAFQAILEDDPDYRLDPYEHPPDVIEFFDMVRATLAMGREEPPVVDPEPQPPEVLRFPVLGYAPLGVHHLQQRHWLRGSLLASSQVALATGSLITGISLYGRHETYDESEHSDLQDRRQRNAAMTAGFYGLWALGVVDGALGWRRDQRRIQAQWQAQHASSRLGLTPTGLRWELYW